MIRIRQEGRRVKPAYSFIADEKAFTGPYTDLIAPAIACAGVILFAYLLYSSYAACASDAYYAAVRSDLYAVSASLINDPAIALDGYPGTLDVNKLLLVDGDEGVTKRYGHPGTMVFAVIKAEDMEWEIGGAGGGRSACVKAPVTVAFNDAISHPGTMTLTMWEG